MDGKQVAKTLAGFLMGSGSTPKTTQMARFAWDIFGDMVSSKTQSPASINQTQVSTNTVRSSDVQRRCGQCEVAASVRFLPTNQRWCERFGEVVEVTSVACKTKKR